MCEPPSKKVRMEGMCTRSQNKNLVIPATMNEQLMKRKKNKKLVVAKVVQEPEKKSEFQITGNNNPFLMYLVVQNLVEHLPVHQLKVCRKVCKLWNELSLPIIFRKCQIQVPSFKNNDQQVESTFFQFLECKPEKQRALRFHKFFQGSEEATKKELKILKDHGKSIYKLVFDRFLMEEWETFLNFIHINVPGLKELQIIFKARYEDHDDDSEDNLIGNVGLMAQPQSLCVKKLVFNFKYCDFDYQYMDSVHPTYFELKRLLRWCPSLTALELVGPYEYVKGSLRTTKSLKLEQLLINSLYLDLDERGVTCEELTNFVKTQDLKELTLFLNLSLDQWKEILSNVKSSLQSLSLKFQALDDLLKLAADDTSHANSRFFTLFGTEKLFPCYQNLETLRLTFDIDSAYEYFQLNSVLFQQVSSNVVCPNLKNLSWLIQEEEGFEMDSTFYGEDFQLAWDLYPAIFTTLSKLFPNVQILHATVENSAIFQDLMKSFPNLIELRVMNLSLSKFQLREFTLLGQAGKKIKRKRKNKNRRPTYQGILNLQGLRHLTLEVDCTLLTDKSVFSGFLQLPELSVLKIRHHPLTKKKWTTNFTQKAMDALTAKGFTFLEVNTELQILGDP